MLISVIIPVYNVEQYLEQCVESVLNQTYRNIEVILVDDGSTDKSAEICDQFAQRDERIIVVHKSNGGSSDARNVGTSLAKGDYLLFMDSDDFWSDCNDLSLLVSEAHKTPECDFIGFNCSYYYSNDRVVKWVKYDDSLLHTISSSQCIEKLVASGTFPMSACMKLLKRESIQGKVEFIKGIYSEDIPWFIDLLSKTQCCRFVNHYMYMYRRGISTSITSSFSNKKFNDLFAIFKQGVDDMYSDWNDNTRNALYSFWAYELCILRAMTGFMDDANKEKFHNELYNYNWLFKYKLNPKVRRVALMRKLLGDSITNYILHIYLKTRLS